MFARTSSSPSSSRSLAALTTSLVAVVALGAFGTGCASTTPDAQVVSATRPARHADSRISHFDRESADYRVF